MTHRMWALIGAVAALVAAGPKTAMAAGHGDFALGPNSGSEACRAMERFDAPKGGAAADIYCGAWERPSGRLTLYPSEAAAQAALAAVCQGVSTQLQSADFTSLTQIACARTDSSGPTRYAMVARRAQGLLIGDVYPSDWTPLVNAARVLGGAAAPSAVTSEHGGETPGLREIQAVYPAGPPGQAAAANYELLLRRAYEYNSIWNFDTSERDFEELLRAHRQMDPDDTAGEAEIFAEIGLNMSNARRFDEATDAFNQADALLQLPRDGLLASKVLNYRALDQLNRRNYAGAMQTALRANQARADIARGATGAAGQSISAGDVGRVERGNDSPGAQRGLLVSLSDAPTTDRATILTAQGYYIAAIAARSLGRSDEGTLLNSAAAELEQVASPPGWLLGAITNEQADSRLAARDYAGAESAARGGLAQIRTTAPSSRGEAHLWLTLEGAQAGQGRAEDALASGRQAIAIFSRQTESPGMPADIAAPHLSLLEQEWRRTGNEQLAAEYFQTMTLVWDSAAARTTAQLAARMVLGQSGASARAYQDGERAYRAALARQQQLAQASNVAPEQMAAADAAVKDASTKLAAAEESLRSKAPAYLELLNPQASADDLRAVLADHEAYLRIVVGARSAFGVLVDKQGVHPFPVSLTGVQLDALADKIRRSTRLHGRLLPDFDMAASGALYAALLGPVADRLADVQNLDVDVSGSLASIPFAALVATAPDQKQLDRIHQNQDYTGVDWLARRLSVSNTLGPASFIRLRRAAAAPSGALRATIYGDFHPDAALVAERLAKARGLSEGCRAQVAHGLGLMGALPETADEAKSVAAKFPGARVVLGDAFTDTDFLTSPDTADADMIMLATHGALAISSCFPEPALLTSVGPTGEGLIEASQLLDRQLKAQLVVLSACDTAAGGRLDEAITGLGDGGDALSGLARGFIYAGARNVLATQWKVDAAASSAEMTAFLGAADQPGVNLGQALTTAQRQLFAQTETAHPFYWAAFVLVGDGGRQLSSH
jgi:CHAT domain-containing protein